MLRGVIMTETKKMERRGGARKGAGRPKEGGFKRINVPLPLVDSIEQIIHEYKMLQKSLQRALQ